MLVREVLARLTAAQPLSNGKPLAVAAVAASAAGELVIRHAVVSTALLADRLSGVSRLVVAAQGGDHAGRQGFAQRAADRDQPHGNNRSGRQAGAGDRGDGHGVRSGRVAANGVAGGQLGRAPGQDGPGNSRGRGGRGGDERGAIGTRFQRAAACGRLPGKSPAGIAGGGGPRSGRGDAGRGQLEFESAGRRSGQSQPVSAGANGQTVFRRRAAAVRPNSSNNWDESCRTSEGDFHTNPKCKRGTLEPEFPRLPFGFLSRGHRASQS